jgi:hypothetical protein
MNAQEIAMWLVSRGVLVEMRQTATGVVYEPRDGFYKSDGIACIFDTPHGPPVLHARYGEVTELRDPYDVVRESKQWHEFSADRFAGWADPPQHWVDLYAEIENEPIPFEVTPAGKAALKEGQ